jgi:tetratricopeptide (TPR) repeat protein
MHTDNALVFHPRLSVSIRSQLVLLAVWTALAAACAPHVRTAAMRPAVAPPPQPAMERQIHNAIDAGDGDYQIRALREKMAAKPDDVQARLDLAQAYRDRGYPDIALEHRRLAAARFPESGAAQLALVRALREMRLQAEAAQGLEEFLRAHPQRAPEYLSWLGILRDDLGQWAQAEAAHRAALNLEPEAEYLHNNLGYNLLMQKKNADAIAEFREALRLNSKSVVASNNLGLALARQNAADQAIQSWQAAGDPAAAHNNLAAVFIQEEKFAEARRELDTALSYNKQFPAALKNLELVSRLDGKVATVTMKPAPSRWDRIKTDLGKIFGSEEPQPASDVKTASVPSTGGGR